jgi:hypothetical protein
MSEPAAISGQAEALSTGLLREAYSCFACGVAAICALAGGKPAGLSIEVNAYGSVFNLRRWQLAD